MAKVNSIVVLGVKISPSLEISTGKKIHVFVTSIFRLLTDDLMKIASRIAVKSDLRFLVFRLKNTHSIDVKIIPFFRIIIINCIPIYRFIWGIMLTYVNVLPQDERNFRFLRV